MGMYSYFVLARPSNLVIDVSKIPNDLKHYFNFEKEISSASSASSSSCTGKNTITLTEFGTLNDRIKFMAYLTLENVARWKSLMECIYLQHKDFIETGPIQLHYLYEETRMFYVEISKDGQFNIFVGSQSDSNYCILMDIVQKLLHSNPPLRESFYSAYGFDVDETLSPEIELNTYSIYLPAYLQSVEENTRYGTYFEKVNLSKLQPDPIYKLLNF